MSDGTVHIVGAGLAGLSAAVTLVSRGRKVVIHELARHAGGRCRSYFESALGLTIDNGNHLLLSGNDSALRYLNTIGGRHLLDDPEHSEFAFCDFASGERWTLRPNDGPLPWWIFSESRRVPNTRAIDYLRLGSLLQAKSSDTITQRVDSGSPVFTRLLHPVLLAALNCDPSEGSAKLAGAVIRETLARGGKACRPLFAANGLGPALVDPALSFLGKRGAELRFDHSLRSIEFGAGRVRALQFAEGAVELKDADDVVLAVPAWVARTLIPDIVVPTEYRSICNAHFAITPPANLPKIMGIVNATTEWLFAFENRLSVTVSSADRFNEAEREPLARQIWTEVAKIARLDAELPRWQIVKERRATFAATPGQNALRPKARTRWKNLILAGDWTDTGLPATIEGAIRSGEGAAKLAMSAHF
ncbi:hydroxysqualene dehydroxylase HpnE [Hyphomicrobium sp. 99]|uniref:hydroxysqualene dehydroxylase HpnE n=1 Tax=Hyphomicrobium sp. 99 TaxID=1163419 RepID=UPI0005F8308F|nr:hydroxysqualene dehydroxylase HpnE [Hyphomicrobium sp. 99]